MLNRYIVIYTRDRRNSGERTAARRVRAPRVLFSAAGRKAPCCRTGRRAK